MVATKRVAYEVSRQQRLEENKKRMEELNLNKLAQDLRIQKPSPMKKVKAKAPKQPLDPSSVRRSSRVADLPPRSYKENNSSSKFSFLDGWWKKGTVHNIKDLATKVPIEPMGRSRSYGYRRRDLSNRVYASDEDREYATQRAEDLQSGLDQDIPSFVKPMLQSHVTGGFWLGLPLHFCKKHLQNRDVIVNLVDEDGVESPTKYLAQKTGLSGGWRGFAIDHELVDGDALVFQLTDPETFKVYIIRVNEHGDGSDQ